MTEAVFKLRVTIEPDDDVQKSETRELSGMVIKSNDEQRYVLMVAYPAMKKDTAVAADGHIDFGQPDVIEKACFSFMRKGCRLGMWHQDGHNPGEVVENYIYRGPTWITKGDDGTEQTIEPGDWLCGMILNPDAWAMYKAGKIGGASPQGRAKRQVPNADTLSRLRD